VLGALRRLRGAAAAPAREAIATVSLAGRDPADLERLRAPLAHLRFAFGPPASPGALLRQLGDPPSWRLDETPADLLGPAYGAAADLARALALAGDATGDAED
jgi:hypothetical protein